MRLGRLVLFVVLAMCARPAQAQAQDPPPPTVTGSSQAPSQPPNIGRIREAVNRPPQLISDDGRLRIYVEVIGKWPTFSELVKDYDLRNGPTRRGAVMTHAEFLSMVTPKEMYSSAGIGPMEMLQA